MNAPQKTAVARVVRAPHGTELSCQNWLIEAAYRMLQNNLDPDVAERPDDLVVYGGIGKAARNWPAFEAILDSLRKLREDETLLVQSGKPVGVFRTHTDAPRVLIANSNLVPHWANWEHFHQLDKAGLMMFGQMTAGSWIYIGAQGIVQGTYETFAEAGRQHYNSYLRGNWILTAGLGDMCFNTSVVVGIEAMAAAQGIDFHRPLQSSALLENELKAIRADVPFLEQDRLMAPDVEMMRLWATREHWPAVIEALLPSFA